MTVYTIANVGDALGSPQWTFDGSNFFVGASGVGIQIGAPTGGDVANSVNVSGNYYVNNVSLSAIYLTQASAAATYETQTAAALLAPLASPALSGTPTAPTAAALTSTTQLATTAFVTGQTRARATMLQSNAPNFSTASTTGVMLGAGATITPAVTGNVLIVVSGIGNNNTSANGIIVSLCSGTGTPPAPNAAITGAITFAASIAISFGTNTDTSVAINVLQTGKALGTTFWYDLAVQATPGGTATLVTYQMNAVEV